MRDFIYKTYQAYNYAKQNIVFWFIDLKRPSRSFLVREAGEEAQGGEEFGETSYFYDFLNRSMIHQRPWSLVCNLHCA